MNCAHSRYCHELAADHNTIAAGLVVTTYAVEEIGEEAVALVRAHSDEVTADLKAQSPCECRCPFPTTPFLSSFAARPPVSAPPDDDDTPPAVDA